MGRKTNAASGKLHAGITRRIRNWKQRGDGGFAELIDDLESATPEQIAAYNEIHARIMQKYPDLSPNSVQQIYSYFFKMSRAKGAMQNNGTSAAV